MNSRSDLLKAKRIRAGLTQTQLAERLGIPKTTYCGYERGHRPVPDGFIEKVERELGDRWVSPKYRAIKRGEAGIPLSCKGCRYRIKAGSYSVCDFLEQTGEPRGCSVENCTRYEKRPHMDKRGAWAAGPVVI